MLLMTHHRGIWKKKSLPCVGGENGLLSEAWLRRLVLQGADIVSGLMQNIRTLRSALWM